ncbi:MAG TPA: hypothetical protein VFD01_20060 [Candidatus Dormibacteraeota bacterium]|jgi:hypothetical protein|nr:hypothetical protein [Candidatus Dormibacteraeota bacterium]
MRPEINRRRSVLGLARLGLSGAALRASILTELEEAGLGVLAEPVARAVAEAIEANNAELEQQLRSILEQLEVHRPPDRGVE